ncbi:MAG: endolytic transglycosylase MltG [Actinobacteria bacterium]|nr:endolytic transglycosylase MltG [Actinomycetota bacterium]
MSEQDLEAATGIDECADGSQGRSRPAGAQLVLLVASVALIVAGLGASWYQQQATPASGPGRRVVVDVPFGLSVAQVASELHSRHVLRSSLAFRIYLAITGVPEVRSGIYQFRRSDSFASVRKVLAHGPTMFPLEVQAGERLTQLAAQVGQIPGHSSKTFLKMARTGAVRSPLSPPGQASLEGLLGPGTYFVSADESDATLLKAMVDRFDSLASRSGLDQAQHLDGVSPYQAVIIASLVQREAGFPGDGGKVARVVYNRLKIGMKLQFDSTVVYALGGVAPLTSADLKVSSPFNTYMVHGLPPTPISMVNTADLRAALHPSPGNWLYFVVVSPDGREAFSATFKEQLANEKLAAKRGLLG